VQSGQILGRLVDDDLRAELAVRTAEAESDTDLRLGELKRAQALTRLKASELLSKRNMISIEELETHRLDAQSAELEIESARHRLHLARLAKGQVEAMLHSREFTTPLAGVVVAVLKNKGESTDSSGPVFRVVDPDTIRVTGSLDVGDAWHVRAGQVVRVTPEIAGAELPIEQEVFTGRIEYVDSEFSPDSQTCKVVAIVSNRDNLLRAGLEARMEILVGSTTPPAAEPTRTSRSDPHPHGDTHPKEAAAAASGSSTANGCGGR
jgi:multidrug efflux pump subunit AcrA (membrane-fusion protein)